MNACRVKDASLGQLSFLDGVLADVESKGEWQCKLDDIENLPEYVCDPQNAKKVVPALQQVSFIPFIYIGKY